VTGPALRDVVLQTLLIVVAGVGLALAFPRTDWEVAWIVLAPVIVTALLRGPRAAFGWGWLYGLTFFLVLLRWLNYTFRVYSEIPWPLTFAPTAALAAYCGFYVGAFAWALSWTARRRSPTLALLAAPFLWVAAEWVRGHLMGGFPWGTLGYSQYNRLPVIQIAELGGVAAVSFVVLAVNTALAGVVVLPWRRAAAGLVVVGALLAGTLAFGAARLRVVEPPGEVAVAVMQPSIEQPLKWDARHTAQTLTIYFALARRVASDPPQLFVWPETTSPTILRRDDGLLKALAQLSKQLGTPLLIGSLDAVDGKVDRYSNAAFLLGEQGIVGRYDKIHLVPFGEYVPLSQVIGFVRSWAAFIADLEAGARATVFQGPPAPFGVVICYEGIFPDLFRQFVKGGARLMINMTNDGWFGRTSGPVQHFAMYPLRAVEHRTAVVRAANTGVSAFIAPTGRVTRLMHLFERGTMTERVPLRSRETLFTRVGDWLSWLSLLVSGAVLAATVRARRT
jgi:apolipoprotein N-acyltransferase